MALTGKDTGLVYRWEDSFLMQDSTTPGDYSEITDSTNKTFGSNVTMGTNEGSNNAVRQFNPMNRQAEYIIEQQFAGSWSVDFTLTNPWWIKAVYGDATSGEETSAPYTYTYDGKFPASMVLIQQTEFPDGTKNHRLYKGCVATSAEISVGVEDTVSVSLSGAYADEELIKDVEADVEAESSPPFTTYTQPSNPERPMHFGEANLYVDQNGDGDVTKRLRVQDASLTLEGNVDMIYELGTRLGVDFSPKALEPSLSYSDIVRNNSDDAASDVQRMYGSSSSTTPDDPNMDDAAVKAKLEFDNGASGSDKNALTFTMAGTFLDTYSRNNVGDPTADIEGDIDRLVTRCTAVVEHSNDSAL